ncbi:MAG: TonB-dependent receptor plug domain-containing protein [Ignavibacteria bacterium]
MNRSCMRLIYLYSLAFINIIYAQNSIIDGKITNMQSLPVMYSSVFLEGINLGATADSMGCFKIEHVMPGDYLISVSSLGYLKDHQKIKIKANEKITINFKLHNDILSFSDIIIHDERSYSASSSFTLNAVDFKLRPKKSAQDLLNLVPGLITAQHAGGGKAEQIFLRGFDADHGTDVHISVDGIPVNMVSHAHGQGYADLHFVMPETIEGILVQKGPYYAANGDFSTAGSIKFNY